MGVSKDKEVLKEQFDADKVLKNLPFVKKQVATKYMKNTENVRRTIKLVIDRDLDEAEHHRLRLLSFDMAIDQVAYKIKDEIGIAEGDLKDMADTLPKKDLIKIIENALIGNEKEKN